MIGLDRVKHEFNTLLDRVEVANAREKAGLKRNDEVMHQVFVGPAGTGKTTAARLLAKGYYAAGVVENDRFVETSGNDLRAGFVGGTAEKVDKLFESAKGGVLFIDEAHTIVSGEQDDFGRQALEKLVKLSEDKRNSTLIILAGYGPEAGQGDVVQRLAQYDQGIVRRFPKRVHFDAYTPKQLGDIGEATLRDAEYVITPGAKRAFRAGAAAAGAHGNQNAGGVRNFTTALRDAHSNRVAKIPDPTLAQLQGITVADVNSALAALGLPKPAPKKKAVPAKKKAPAKKAVPVVEAAP